MSEFTGERLIPGEVDADLWNEHISRYAFAASLCCGRERVIDAGCGTGYGSRYLSAHGQTVLGIDISADAIGFASRRYKSRKTQFAVGACEALPVVDATADLLVAFEVIEHLSGWRAFLAECRRALSPDGLLLVSTPNKSSYTESRGAAGANPFHVHEFAFEEFSEELSRVFPHVQLLGQNHSESIVFSTASDRASAAFGSLHSEPSRASYFIAVCGKRSLEPVANFVFVPTAANVLQEREQHIQLLRSELNDKDAELQTLHREHAGMVANHRALLAELKRSNEWAESLNAESQARAARVADLQMELVEAQQQATREIQRITAERDAERDMERAAALVRFAELDHIIQERTGWAQSLDAELAARGAELARCVALLDAAEETVEVRTLWAQGLQTEVARLSARIATFEASRWVKAGRAVRLGPPPE